MQSFKEGFLTILQISEVLLQWMNKVNVKSGEQNAVFKIPGCFTVTNPNVYIVCKCRVVLENKGPDPVKHLRIF